MAVAPDPLAVEQVRPSLDEVRALAAGHGLVPLALTFVEDCETPVSAYLKLRAMAAGEPAFLLESADQGQVGRWSFIGVRPREVLRWNLADGGDPYALAAERTLAANQAPLADGPPFTGGAVGYFGYDLVRAVEPLGPPPPDELGLPDMALMLTDTLVAFDHLRHTVTIIANADLREGADVDGAYGHALEAIAAVRAALAGPVPRAAGAAHEPPEFVSNMGAARFEEAVARIVRYIHAGDAFQVVPSQRWSAEIPVEAFSVYRALRTINPSPYMYFLDFGDFQVVGASPEPLVTVNGRRVATKPIAGTRPRGERPEDDRRLAAELLADEKERAEHVMLVDLGRNDLGRVCEYGTVHVDELMEIEYYSHVMHIVSSVSGTLREGVGALDALRAVLPAGTLSGAPKFRAMQIIDELEPVKRGGYGGAVGYLSYGGDLDTAIHIRTVVVTGGRAYVQAGGGTVADARPDAEQRESVAKSQAVLRAVALACRQPEWP
ncbi:MAG TPA: anthranilate synthase component I [Solirubrobacteraceae bacterium]|nr:anthranilate synthase component I [Solirubrobacteraceae bacterium]